MSEDSGSQETGELQIVTLRRAERAADLWPAVEAAQYGHIVQRDEDGGIADPAAARAFVAALAEVIEDWEGAPERQAALIQKLDAALAALFAAGSRVHWGIVHRAVQGSGGGAVEIPVAIFRLGPSPSTEARDEVVEIAVPTTLGIAAG